MAPSERVAEGVIEIVDVGDSDAVVELDRVGVLVIVCEAVPEDVTVGVTESDDEEEGELVADIGGVLEGVNDGDAPKDSEAVADEETVEVTEPVCVAD